MTDAQTHSLYNGETKITFYPNDHPDWKKRHTYWDEKGRLATGSGVPRLLAKPALRAWMVNQAIEVFEKGVEYKPDDGGPLRLISLAGSQPHPDLAQTDASEVRVLDEVERQFLVKAAKSRPRQKKEAAGNMGTIAHNWLE
jgi:alpha-glucosidase (family GH31 glycosyl hydrolase)